ncbi:MAG: TonB-dependent receptor [Chlorobi bacterium]|nr:TonB-dependent receptor [Chlorobiota bacterium]
MKRTAFHITLITLAWLVFMQVQGQMMSDTLTLDQFEVIGMQQDFASPVKKAVMDSTVMHEMNTSDLAELLASFTPVSVRTYGSGALATASFRGTGASHTKVLWNGFGINSPMLGSTDLSLVPNSFFNRMELYYGAASMRETSGALGGSVLLEYDNHWTKQPSVDFEQVFGSFHTMETTAGISVGGKKFGSDTRIVYRTSKNDFPYYNNAVVPARKMTQENANISNAGFTQQFNYRFNRNNEIDVVTWNQWNVQNIPPVMTNVDRGGDQKEYLKDFFSRNSVRWVWQKKQNKLEVSAAALYDDMNYKLQRSGGDDSTGPVTLIDSKNRTGSYSGKVKYSREFKNNFVLVTGTDAVFERVNSNNYDSAKRRTTFSVYGDLVKDFNKRLRLNLLLRAEMTDGILLPVMPLFGMNYRLMKREQLYVRANISRNYHLPTLNDLYWSPGGNPELKPEDGLQTEGGLKYIKKLSTLTLSADVSVYASWINNWILWTPGNFQYWSPQNIAEVFARGLEFTFRVQGTKGNFSYYGFAEYAFTKTTNESQVAERAGYDGKQLIYIPTHSANGFVHAAYKGFYLGWNVHFTGERNTSLNSEESYSNTLPAYFLNDVSAGKILMLKKARLELRFRVNNLFNENYQAVRWRAMPGRNYELSVKFNLN